MRVLLSTVPAVGHLMSLLPLGAALQRRGHDVAVVSGPSMAALLPDGMPLLPAGPDLPEMLAAIPPRPADAPPVEPVSPHGLSMFFGAMRVAVALEQAAARADEWRPDLVVSEGLDSVGLVLAAERGLPHTTVGLGPVCSRATAAAMRDKLAELGLPAAPTTWYDPWPFLLRPPGWQQPLPARALGVGTVAAVGSIVPPPGEGPAVLVSFGTLFDEPVVLAPLVRALTDRGLRVVCALGPVRDPDQLDVDHERVRVHRFGPLDGVLDAVDAVVCHGGAGTVLAALAHGRPPVVLPQGADHHLVAAGVEAAGAGRVLPGDTTPEALAAAVVEVVSDAATRDAVRRVAERIAAEPGPDEVAAAWEATYGTAAV